MTANAIRPFRPSRLVQLLAVLVGSTALTLAADRLQIRTPLNFFWILAVPALIGLGANQRLGRRLGMALLLPGISVLSLMMTGQLFGSMA